MLVQLAEGNAVGLRYLIGPLKWKVQRVVRPDVEFRAWASTFPVCLELNLGLQQRGFPQTGWQDLEDSRLNAIGNQRTSGAEDVP